MERLTYWNCKEKGSALPVQVNDLGDTVDLETLCCKLATYEDAEEDGRLAWYETGSPYKMSSRADSIMAMTDEELLVFLKQTVNNAYMCKLMNVEPNFLSLDWLQHPVESDDVAAQEEII